MSIWSVLRAVPDFENSDHIGLHPISDDKWPDEREFAPSPPNVAPSQGKSLQTVSGLDETVSKPLCSEGEACRAIQAAAASTSASARSVQTTCAKRRVMASDPACREI